MFGERSDEEAVLAEHGRWIAILRDDARLFEQRLRSLELRISTLEVNIAELAKLYNKLDLTLALLSDELARLTSRVDAIAGRGHRCAKSRGHRG